MNELPTPKGWHSRGYLPHFDGGEILQFITLHLGDALPHAVWLRWKAELAHEEKEIAERELRRRSERYLDQGYGACHLRKPGIAKMVQKALLHFDADRYKLLAWVVMPNHLHFMLKPINSHSLSDILKNFKSYTAHEVNKTLRRNGQFWQEDYFDRFIRDYDHYENVMSYIARNPVKARLCKAACDWPFSSFFRVG